MYAVVEALARPSTFLCSPGYGRLFFFSLFHYFPAPQLRFSRKIEFQRVKYHIILSLTHSCLDVLDMGLTCRNKKKRNKGFRVYQGEGIKCQHTNTINHTRLRIKKASTFRKLDVKTSESLSPDRVRRFQRKSFCTASQQMEIQKKNENKPEMPRKIK